MKRPPAIPIPSPEDNEEVARRLRLLRQALGIIEGLGKDGITQGMMADRVGVGTNSWQSYETGGRIPSDRARVLFRRHHVSLNWIYEGLEGQMPSDLMTIIRALEREEEAA